MPEPMHEPIPMRMSKKRQIRAHAAVCVRVCAAIDKQPPRCAEQQSRNHRAEF